MIHTSGAALYTKLTDTVSFNPEKGMGIGISSGSESIGSPIKDVATGQTNANVLIEKPIMAKVVFSETLTELPPKLAEQLRQILPQLTLPLYRVQLGLEQQKLITFSQTPLPAGQMLQLNPLANGQLQARPLPSLELASLTRTPLNMPPLDLRSLPLPAPAGLLNTAKPITPASVQSALSNSGQWFERDLLRAVTNPPTTTSTATTPLNPPSGATVPGALLNTQTTATPSSPVMTTNSHPGQGNTLLQPANQPAPQEAQANLAPQQAAPALTTNTNKPTANTEISQFWGKIQNNVKHMGSWLDAALQGKTPLATPADKSTPTQNNTLVQNSSVITPSAVTSLTSALPANALQQDVKAWLIHIQHQLHATLNQHLANKGLSTHPWLPSTTEVSTHLQQPRPLSLWPQNISWQPVLLNTLQETSPTDDPKQDALVKLLLQVSQGLGRIQQDQIGNRQQQTVSPQLDMTLQLPYLDQQQLRFVELELQEKTSQKPGSKQMLRAWHMILRFEQAEPFPFAIELNLHSMQLNLHCWAREQEHLGVLREKMPQLRNKLTQAGFHCQQLDTKLGNPPPLKRHIQQYQVDIHT